VRENPVRAGLVLQWKDWPFVGEIFSVGIPLGSIVFGAHRAPLQHRFGGHKRRYSNYGDAVVVDVWS
jgi:hypothetical protein